MEIPLFNANSGDPDQTPHNAASDLGLHCLPMSFLWDDRHNDLRGAFCFVFFLELDPFSKGRQNQLDIVTYPGSVSIPFNPVCKF